FLASLIPLLVYVALRAQAANGRATFALVGSIGLAAFIFPLILVNGSRAGAGAAVGAHFSSAFLWWHLQARRGKVARQGRGLKRWLGPLLLGMAALLGVLTWWLSRSLAIQRLAGGSLAEELRIKALPYALDMIGSYFPVGSGFGSFDLAYKVIEPSSLLMPEFLNQAHNDLLQLLIEGGAPAAAIVAVALGWFAVAGFRSWRVFSAVTDPEALSDAGVFAWLSLAVLLGGSLVDYPLRTPSLMVVAVLLACIVQRSGQANRQPADER
ncbi:MAG: O-antigen ligase family protein, partial [Tsuneonella sp.]